MLKLLKEADDFSDEDIIIDDSNDELTLDGDESEEDYDGEDYTEKPDKKVIRRKGSEAYTDVFDSIRKADTVGFFRNLRDDDLFNKILSIYSNDFKESNNISQQIRYVKADIGADPTEFLDWFYDLTDDGKDILFLIQKCIDYIDFKTIVKLSDYDPKLKEAITQTAIDMGLINKEHREVAISNKGAKMLKQDLKWFQKDADGNLVVLDKHGNPAKPIPFDKICDWLLMHGSEKLKDQKYWAEHPKEWDKYLSDDDFGLNSFSNTYTDTDTLSNILKDVRKRYDAGHSIKEEIEIVDDKQENKEDLDFQHGFKFALNDLTKNLWDLIDNVESLNISLNDEEYIKGLKNSEDIQKILGVILEDLTIDVGMVNKAVEMIDGASNALIDKGAEKAEEIVAAEEE